MSAPTITHVDGQSEPTTVVAKPKITKAKPDRDLVVYSTRSGRWHWKLLSPNGQVVSARSGPDGYKRRDDAAAAAKHLIGSIGAADVRLVVHKADGTIDDRGLI